MDTTVRAGFLPHDDPAVSVAFYRESFGFEVRSYVGYDGMYWSTVAPAARRIERR